MLKSRCVVSVAGIFLLAAMMFNASAEEKTTSGTRKSVSSTKSKSSAKSSQWRRLPPGYGKLKLSDKQKTEIYDLREEYGARIDELESEIAAIRKEMEDDCEDALTSTQRKTFNASRNSADTASAKEKASASASRSRAKSTTSKGKSRTSGK